MNTDKIKQFEDLLDGRRLNDAQVARIVKMLAKIVLDAQKRTDNAAEKVQSDLEGLKKQLKTALSGALSDMKGQVDTVFVESRLRDMELAVHTLISGAQAHVSTLERGKDGLEGPPGAPGQDGADGSPDTPQQIVQKLESLQGTERLHFSAIDGLEERLKSSGGGTVFVGGGPGGNAVQYYDLSGSLDGATKTFSLPAFNRIISVHLSSFPTIMRPTVDFSVDPNAMQITFTDEIDAETSLSSGQTLLVVYAA